MILVKSRDSSAPADLDDELLEHLGLDTKLTSGYQTVRSIVALI